jgi:transcriptional regulator with XRE-family HTH domain
MTHPLRRYRHKSNVTLERLAGDVGISKSFLSKIEAHKARPSLSVVDRIVAVTNGEVSANDFLSQSSQGLP